MVAGKAGIDVVTLTNGSYKLVIEPVIYLIYNNLYFAMTTTEAGLYNRMVGGDLGAHFPTVVMKNLALALFLEKADLGFPAYTGSKTTARSTDEMIQTLGIGIISYKGAPPTEAEYDAVYRIDTDDSHGGYAFRCTCKPYHAGTDLCSLFPGISLYRLLETAGADKSGIFCTV